MGGNVSDNFYSQESTVHRVASVSYSEDGESVRTFCDESFPIEDKEEVFSVPIKLLDRTEICIECERSHSHIRYNQFNFEDKNKEYKFFVKATLKLGDRKGFIVQETVEADSVEEAKNLIEEEYKKAELYRYYYISRTEKYGEWDVLTDERNS